MTKEQKNNLIRIIAAAVLLIVLHFVELDRPVMLVLYLIPYLIVGYDILYKAFRGIAHGQPLDENLLMVIATLGALALAVTQTGDFTEAVAVMLFYQIGELFQDIAIQRSQQKIDELMGDRQESAEEAEAHKSHSERFISRFARIYTPVVVICAVCLAILPPVLRMTVMGMDPQWSVWIYRALTFLVVSCPCALVISIPMSFFAGIGRASRDGVLVKDSNTLEALAKVNTADIGDDIRDGASCASALSLDGIRIAVGASGSDQEIEAADVVLMEEDPSRIAWAIRLSRMCMRIVKENIWFAIGIKLLCLILGGLGIVGMWAAVFADVGVMILAVMNAIRPLFIRGM